MTSPFTAAQAASRGLTPGLLRSGAVRREHHGVYVDAYAELGVETSIAAARLVLPSDVLLDGVSALQSYGVDVGDLWPLRFVSALQRRVRRPDIRVRRVATLPEGDRGRTGPASAFVAAALELDLVELVTAGDWLVRLGWTTCAELAVAAVDRRGRGAVLARLAADLVRERVDSPRETRLRLCLLLAGIPEPEVNPMVVVRGRTVGRIDLYLRPWQVAVEYEGDQHRTDAAQWNVDIRRAEQLAADGALIRVTAERMRHPRSVVIAVLRALRAAGYDGPEPVFDERWHRLFPTGR